MPNPYLIIAALVIVIVAFICGGVIGYEYRAGKVPAELLAQQDTDTKECGKSQQITKGSNDAIQKDRDAIARKLATLRVQHPSACVSVAGTANLSAGREQHAGQNGAGVSADTLNEYAAEAETYRKELMVCTEFLAQERKVLTQPQ